MVSKESVGVSFHPKPILPCLCCVVCVCVHARVLTSTSRSAVPPRCLLSALRQRVTRKEEEEEENEHLLLLGNSGSVHCHPSMTTCHSSTSCRSQHLLKPPPPPPLLTAPLQSVSSQVSAWTPLLWDLSKEERTNMLEN